MFTDIVGYTALTQADEESALRLLREQEDLVRPLLPAYQGREIKATGDGFLVEFESALRAVQCAIDIQQHFQERNARAGVQPIQLRIGIHLGDVEERGGDVYGDAVNIASRIQPLARPGGICLSAEVSTQLRGKIPNRFEKLESKPLKGLRLPVDVFRVVLPWETPEPTLDGSARPRLAVLPLTNISPDPSDEYFADGLTEELIGALSKLRDLRVIARTSVGQYKSTPKTVAQIGAELGVSSILEGSVRKAGKRLRITLQLVSVATEEHIWAETYDRELDDVFAIQSDVASKVAGSLSHGILGKASERDSPDVEAYLSYLRAVQLLHEDTDASLRESVRLFDRAIEQDPEFARAYAGLARAWAGLVMRGGENYDMITLKAEPAARRSLELAPDLAEGHAALADVHGLLDRFEDAIVESRRAIEISPNLSEAYETLGRPQIVRRGLEEALPTLRRAYELDPLSVRTGGVLAWAAQLAGREEEAREVLERMERIHPNDPTVCDALAEFYRLKGDLPRARAALDRGLRAVPNDEALRVDLGVWYAMSGMRNEAEELLRELDRSSREAGRLNAKLYIRAALGDLDPAFEALDRLVEMHAWPAMLGVNPTFEAMRKDLRFAAVRVRIGLPA